MIKQKRRRKAQHSSIPSTDLIDAEVQEEANKLFQKIFCYKRSNDSEEQWVLPSADSLHTEYWIDEELQKLKSDLNDVKSLLSDHAIDEWQTHTHNTNLAALIVSNVKKRCAPDVCTQAWCKFYEILHHFNVLACHMPLPSYTSLVTAPPSPPISSNTPKSLHITSQQNQEHGQQEDCGVHEQQIEATQQYSEDTGNSDAEGKIERSSSTCSEQSQHTDSSRGSELQYFEPLTTLHLCEAPGGFIGAINHYAQSNGISIENWSWTGVTLNPYNEMNSYSNMIDNERLIYHTVHNWEFGTDNTGNIMSKENFAALKDRMLRSECNVNLITADGSIDCQNNPGEQEAITSSLHTCEVLCALHLLGEGGNLVVKMFTLLECQAVSTLYLLCCVFESVNVFKPACSKSGNSEVYVVCLGYKKLPSAYLDALTLHYGDEIGKHILFPQSAVPSSFLQLHRQCCMMFVQLQVTTIRQNIHMFTVDNASTQHQAVAKLQAAVLETYMNLYQLRRIPSKHYSRLIVYPKKAWGLADTTSTLRHLESRHFLHSGSYHDRQLWQSLHWKKQLLLMQPCCVHPSDSQVYWLQSDNNAAMRNLSSYLLLDLHHGCRIAKLNNCRFCDSQLLGTYNHLIETLQRALCDINDPNGVDTQQMISEPSVNAVVDVLVQELQCVMSPAELHSIHVHGVTGRHEQLVDKLRAAFKSSSQPTDSGTDTPSAATSACMAVCSTESWLLSCHHTHKQLIADEIDAEHKLNRVQIIHNTIRNLQAGDHILVPFPGVMTRFYGGIFYWLYLIFDRLTLLPASRDVGSPYLLCGLYLRERSHRLLDHLQSVVMALQTLQPVASSDSHADSDSHVTDVKPNLQDRDVVQLMPMKCLYEPHFYRYVNDFNNRRLSLAINAIIAHLKPFCEGEIELTEDEQRLAKNKVTGVRLPQKPAQNRLTRAHNKYM